ncbi:MAG TPA: DUF423 domain-containing protein [Aliidongia sp.]|nr:DUF423 domain-containing protein [Aliidongia sp.]
MANRWIVAAGLGGCAGVALGAMGRHIGGESGEGLFLIASRYLLYHAAALLAVALLEARAPARSLTVAGWCFLLGMLGFGGGLVAQSLTGSALAGLSTPVGGTLFMLGWLALAAYGWGQRR